MKTIRIKLISDWYVSRALQLFESVSMEILQIREDAENGIFPSAKNRKSMTALTGRACLYLNKAAVINPDIDLTDEIRVRNSVCEFIYN